MALRHGHQNLQSKELWLIFPRQTLQKRCTLGTYDLLLLVILWPVCWSSQMLKFYGETMLVTGAHRYISLCTCPSLDLCQYGCFFSLFPFFFFCLCKHINYQIHPVPTSSSPTQSFHEVFIIYNLSIYLGLFI